MKSAPALSRCIAANRLGVRLLAAISLLALASCATREPVSRQASRAPLEPPARATTAPAPAAPLVRAPAPPAESAPIETYPLPGVPAALHDKFASLQTWIAQQDRLYRVAAPLLINNTELCPHHARNLLGFTAKTKYSYSEDFIAVAQSGFGLEERLRIMSVLPGSGASLAGMLAGDILLAAEIEPLPQGPDAESAAATLIASEIQGRSRLGLTVLRDGERITLDVPLTPACAMVVDLGNTDEINSYADGHRVMITRGMLNFVQSDEELAYALAREIAHNVVSSSPRPDMGAVIDRLRTLNPGAPSANPEIRIAPLPPALDASADKLALYMLVRAGYELGNVQNFWTRLTTAYPAEIENSPTALHPLSGDRLSVLSQIIETIEMKRKNGLPLIP